MTDPCIDSGSFELVDGTHLRPKDHMQWRHVATNYTPATVLTFDINDGIAKDELLHSVQVQWTNTTPINQYAYALLTRAGSKVILQGNCSGYIQTKAGQTSGVSPADPSSLTAISRFGIGFERGKTALDTAYYVIAESRMAERTMLFGDRVLLTPGETVKFKAELRFVSHYWDYRTPQGGLSETESNLDTGASQLDVFAYPAL